MDTGADIRTEPGEDSATTTDKACAKTRDASFGIVVAVIVATLLWAALIGAGVYVFETWR